MDGEQQVSTGHAVDTYEIVVMCLNPLKPSFSNAPNCLNGQKWGIFFLIWERSKSDFWCSSLTLPYAYKSTLLLGHKWMNLGNILVFSKKCPIIDCKIEADHSSCLDSYVHCLLPHGYWGCGIRSHLGRRFVSSVFVFRCLDRSLLSGSCTV
jgi:hypothetical protein